MTHSCTYATLRTYLEHWTVPKSFKNPLYLFDADHAKRHIKSENFGSTASDMLALAPMLSRFIRRVVQPQIDGSYLEPYVASMLAAFNVVYLLQSAKIENYLQPNNLRRAIEYHLDTFKAAYGADAIRSKHHYALHLPSQLATFGFLISTFTHERKHRAFKRYARPRVATRHFELGVIEDMLAINTWELQHNP